MTKYTCEKCGRVFTHKGTYRRHINRKQSCADEIGSKSDKKHKCKLCEKSFKSYASLYYHMKKNVCGKGDIDNAKVLQNVKVDAIDKNIENVNVDKNIENVNVDGDVKVVKFGNENLSYMSDDLYKQILGRGLRSVQEFIEHSNFHPDHPENHNIYIANIRDEYLVLFDGKRWIITDRDEKMEDIIYAKSDHLDIKFNELKHEMDPRDVAKFQKFIEKRDDDAVMKKIKGELTLQFYNNRDMPQRQRKRMEMVENQILKDKVNNTVSIRRQQFEHICDLIQNETDGSIEEIRKILDAVNSKYNLPAK